MNKPLLSSAQVHDRLLKSIDALEGEADTIAGNAALSASRRALTLMLIGFEQTPEGAQLLNSRPEPSKPPR